MCQGERNRRQEVMEDSALAKGCVLLESSPDGDKEGGGLGCPIRPTGRAFQLITRTVAMGLELTYLSL